MRKNTATRTKLKNKETGLITDVQKLVASYPKVPITIDCIIFGYDEKELQVLLIRSDLAVFNNQWSLLGDFAIDDNEDLDAAAQRIVVERTGMENVFLEQVRTFGHINRHPGGRVITIAYCSLINSKDYKLKVFDNELHWHNVSSITEMAFDHIEILDYCLCWLQKRVQEHPLAFNLLPEKFSLRDLQLMYEAILGVKLDRRNFRKKIASMNVLIDINEMEKDVPHRPGKLYKFDFDKYQQNKKNWIGIDFF